MTITISPYVFAGIPDGIKYINAMNRYNPEQIINKTCTALAIQKHRLLSPVRKARYTEVRYMLFNILHERSGEFAMTLVAIGKLFGRDHSTVIHGLQMHKNYMAKDEVYHRNYVKLYNHLAYDEDYILEVPARKPRTKKAENDDLLRKLQISRILEREVGESFEVTEHNKWRIMSYLSQYPEGKYAKYRFKTTKLANGFIRFTRTC